MSGNLSERGAPSDSSNKQRVSFSLDLRWVSLALLVALVGVLLAWKPWSAQTTGERTITATPDEFIFTPSYEFMNADKATAIKEVTDKSNEIVPKLKTLGVPSNKIKTDSTGYNYNWYYNDSTQDYTYTLTFTVTVTNEKLAQTVQDYLAGTAPSGSVTPYAQFSDSLQKKLEAQARDKATKDARAKADQSAKNLGFSVSKVKSINDGSFNGGNIQSMLMQGSNLDAGTKESTASLPVQPGENDLDYSVTVVYYIR